MHSSASLLDIHERSHRGLIQLIAHCAEFSTEQFVQEIEGFGYNTLQRQLCHIIGAEMYWFGVLQGRMDTEDRESQNPKASDLANFHLEVFADGQAYLKESSAETLNTPAELTTWGPKQMTLVPAHVVLRTQMHLFQHQGQMTAMCRLLGRPINKIDYPHGV